MPLNYSVFGSFDFKDTNLLRMNIEVSTGEKYLQVIKFSNSTMEVYIVWI